MQRVSIHSQLLGWEMLAAGVAAATDELVSIHSQLLGWEMLKSLLYTPINDASFNPLPAFRLGDAQQWRDDSLASSCFNPLPAFRLGDAGFTSAKFTAACVSIHSQLLGWEMRRPMA